MPNSQDIQHEQVPQLTGGWGLSHQEIDWCIVSRLLPTILREGMGEVRGHNAKIIYAHSIANNKREGMGDRNVIKPNCH